MSNEITFSEPNLKDTHPAEKPKPVEQYLNSPPYLSLEGYFDGYTPNSVFSSGYNLGFKIEDLAKAMAKRPYDSGNAKRDGSLKKQLAEVLGVPTTDQLSIIFAGEAHLASLTHEMRKIGYEPRILSHSSTQPVEKKMAIREHNYLIARMWEIKSEVTPTDHINPAIFIADFHGADYPLPLPPVDTLLQSGIKTVHFYCEHFTPGNPYGIYSSIEELLKNSKLNSTYLGVTKIANQLKSYSDAGIIIKIEGFQSIF